MFRSWMFRSWMYAARYFRPAVVEDEPEEPTPTPTPTVGDAITYGPWRRRNTEAATATTVRGD